MIRHDAMIQLWLINVQWICSINILVSERLHMTALPTMEKSVQKCVLQKISNLNIPVQNSFHPRSQKRCAATKRSKNARRFQKRSVTQKRWPWSSSLSWVLVEHRCNAAYGQLSCVIVWFCMDSYFPELIWFSLHRFIKIMISADK